MYKIVIIGAGQLGSRHLQGLKLSQNILDIYVIDQSEEALAIAQHRYDQVEGNDYHKEVTYSKNINELPTSIDLAILATGSKPRAILTKILLDHSNVHNIIFEKVLFPRISEYSDILDLINSKGVSAWVNCPRRTYDFYKKIKRILDLPFTMTIEGTDWGLCCNAIHYIDIFMMLSGESEYKISTDISQLEDSKRDGYIEMLGTINIETMNGCKLRLSSVSSPTKSIVNITSLSNIISIDTDDNIMKINGIIEHVNIPYQSSLTGNVVDEIINFNNCNLTPFEISCNYHKPFIKAIINEYNKLTGCKGELCPIT